MKCKMWNVSAMPGRYLRPVVAALGAIFSAHPRQRPSGVQPDAAGRGAGRLGGQVKGRDLHQEGSGSARNRARARSNWFCQGQPWGRMSIGRRALRMMRRAREKKRRPRVSVVVTGSLRPMQSPSPPVGQFHFAAFADFDVANDTRSPI